MKINKYLVILILTALCIGYKVQASEFTIEDIAEGLISSQSQFNDIKITFSTDEAIKDSNGKIERFITNSIYANKKSEGCEYLETKTRIIDKLNSKDELIKNQLVSYNGERTLWLDKREDERGLKRAAIYAGKKEEYFPGYITNPSQYIWNWSSSTSYYDLLKDKKSIFQVIGQEEINGINCIQIKGSILDGAGTMTLWISPIYNFIPIKMRLIRNKDNRLIDERITSDFKKLPDNSWFPMKIQFGNPSAEWSKCYCYIETISLDKIDKNIFSPALPLDTHVTDYVLKLSYTTSDAADAGLAELNNLPNKTNSGDSNTNEVGLKQNTELTQKKLEEYVDNATVKITDQNQVNDDSGEQLITTNSKTDEQSSNRLFLWAAGIALLVVLIVLSKFAFTVKKGGKDDKN